MQKDLQKRVLDAIARHGMIRPGDRVGLGVSGGADSVALLRIFEELRAQLGITLFVLHFHHQLRGAEADEDERFVKTLARAFQLEFESGRADVAAEAKRNRWNLEDAARRLRYDFFASAASSRGLDRVAVAHNANDQAETVLSHLLRGTGLAGLAGIHPVAGLIVRPLLGIGREELREYLSGLSQRWREDATNEDTSRTRARIRHELLPLLVRDFNGEAVAHLARLASHAREEEAFWRALEEERFRALATRDSSGAITAGTRELLAPLPFLPRDKTETPTGSACGSQPDIAVARRLIRRIYAELRGSREQLTSQHVESVIDLAARSQSGAAIDLPGIRVERIFDRLRFMNAPVAAVQSSETRPANPEFAYTLASPANADSVSVAVPEIHRRFSLKRVDWPPAGSETGLGRGALDYDRVQWPLVLRNWRPGDSFRPHGSRRVRKLKRLLLESRVPRNARGGWPVLTSGEKVIWAAGFPAAQDFAPSGETQAGLVIDEEEL
jgi:tRNA(Ile)-lysidine synthase